MLIERASGGGNHEVWRCRPKRRCCRAVALSGCSSDDTSAGQPSASKTSVPRTVNVRVQESRGDTRRDFGTGG